VKVVRPHSSEVSKSVFSLVLFAMLFALCLSAQAQQPKKVPRIGFASGGPGQATFEAFRQGLRELGYVEGQNIFIEHRDARVDWTVCLHL
jgi:putative ABC transport system substrate-binding protein